MAINSWEGMGTGFLENSFDEDAADIVSYLTSIKPKTVMEVGFGNNRLLRRNLEFFKSVNYYGYDKTRFFVKNARMEFIFSNTFFHILDIGKLENLTKIVKVVKPDALILRYILEHLPTWRNVLECINKLSIPSILISLYTTLQKKYSISMDDDSRRHTLNFFRDSELDSLLNSYTLSSLINYEGRSQRLRIYEIIK
jgi:hypothetical protein